MLCHPHRVGTISTGVYKPQNDLQIEKWRTRMSAANSGAYGAGRGPTGANHPIRVMPPDEVKIHPIRSRHAGFLPTHPGMSRIPGTGQSDILWCVTASAGAVFRAPGACPVTCCPTRSAGSRQRLRLRRTCLVQMALFFVALTNGEVGNS